MSTDIYGTCPSCEVEFAYHGCDGHQYSRIVGIEYSQHYDGVLIWACPDCGFMWPRFEDGRLAELGRNVIEEARRAKEVPTWQTHTAS